MRASDPRLVLIGLVLVATSAGAAAPVLRGDDEAAASVRDGWPAGRVADPSSVAYGILRDDGWLWARLAPDSTAEGDPVLRIDPGPRARLGVLTLRSRDEELGEVWTAASGFLEGLVLRPRVLDVRLRRGLRVLGERGHPFASATIVDQVADPLTGVVDLTIALVPGPRTRIGAVEVEGARHTRPEVLARLSGLEPGALVRESSLVEARARLENRARLIRAVDGVDLRRRPGDPDAVDVVLSVRQTESTGSFAAALGAVRGEDDETRISGSVDLVLLDLFGTARAFEGRWSDDGATRRRLDLSYLEPTVFGTGFDLGLEIGQRHEDDAFDLVRGDLRLELPGTGGRDVSFRVGADRTTFAGETGRVRLRQRFGGGIGLERRRPDDDGLYGRLRSTVEAARVVDRRNDPEPGDERIEASTSQTLVELHARLANAFGRNVAVRLDADWRSTETDALPLPRSEQWAIGGATTVRGYAEDRFLGERVAWSRAELVLGPRGGGQGFGFVDVGWVRTTGENTARERWLQGFGVGLRSPTALGAVDLSLGFAERVGFDAGKLHLVLVRSF